MFGRPLPWGRDPLPDMHSLLNTRSRHRHPRARVPSLPEPQGLPTSTHHRPREPRQQPTYPKHLRSSDLSTPPSTTSLSEWEFDTYMLGHDDDDDDDDEYDIDDSEPHRLPRFVPARARHPPRHSTPDVQRASVNLPRDTAAELRADELLLLPALTHLHIRMRMRAPYAARDETLCAAVPGTMRFGDVVSSVVAMCFGDGVRRGHVTACVKQRGQWRQLASELTLDEVAPRGEVFGDGRREVEVKIEVSDDGEREQARGRFSGRGPRGSGFGVERVLEREESRFRVDV
ncbi:uncharacterized protein EKO05_0002941 [Ascochyta rabiei]|uniref:Uncharacterized protein n=1 Tax=Didymella rabiei TaxID=5454 RepID=A0A162X0X1_DIDRA|nr:uncharacterized protein EKO05_0002941 [Ascochyta rabiei]KZM19299.1 hypothetical protein ST47_g9511 [Ascochyta rabiei]UPX12392.1 hypothetical protein EKO05_0002941 [Ascochyta rabiei]